MNLKEVLDGISCLSARAVVLALRRPSELSRYISHCLKTYDELVGKGLPPRGPVDPAPDMTIALPAYHLGGGMSFNELAFLARAVKALKPKTIFEIGSYNGLTTAVFVLNSEADARVLTLDLPTVSTGHCTTLWSDAELVASRRLLDVPQALGLSRYSQILCDSMQFDPLPYANSVDLGLVDGAHDLVHVRNDTMKMAMMMADRGIVFWHDYGGKGPLRPLAAYLEALAKSCPLYRIRGTTLAWGAAWKLKRAILPDTGSANSLCVA